MSPRLNVYVSDDLRQQMSEVDQNWSSVFQEAVRLKLKGVDLSKQKVNLYEYVIYYVPEEDSDESPEIVGSSLTLAKDERSVVIKAAKAIPDTYTGKEDRLEVAVRPFCGA